MSLTPPEPRELPDLTALLDELAERTDVGGPPVAAMRTRVRLARRRRQAGLLGLVASIAVAGWVVWAAWGGLDGAGSDRGGRDTALEASAQGTWTVSASDTTGDLHGLSDTSDQERLEASEDSAEQEYADDGSSSRSTAVATAVLLDGEELRITSPCGSVALEVTWGPDPDELRVDPPQADVAQASAIDCVPEIVDALTRARTGAVTGTTLTLSDADGVTVLVLSSAPTPDDRP